jgi:GxxExxY protein
MTLRIPSPLSEELEAVVFEVIGAAIAVHRELGPGLNEVIYQRALALELEAAGLTHDVERSVPILYKGVLVHQHRLDLVVDERLIVESKSVERLTALHVAQTIGYLRATGIRIGLLMNFNVPILKAGIRRIVV